MNSFTPRTKIVTQSEYLVRQLYLEALSLLVSVRSGTRTLTREINSLSMLFGHS